MRHGKLNEQTGKGQRPKRQQSRQPAAKPRKVKGSRCWKKKKHVAVVKSRDLGVTKFGFGSCLHASFVTLDNSFNVSDPQVSCL